MYRKIVMWNVCRFAIHVVKSCSWPLFECQKSTILQTTAYWRAQWHNVYLFTHIYFIFINSGQWWKMSVWHGVVCSTQPVKYWASVFECSVWIRLRERFSCRKTFPLLPLRSASAKWHNKLPTRIRTSNRNLRTLVSSGSRMDASLPVLIPFRFDCHSSSRALMWYPVDIASLVMTSALLLPSAPNHIALNTFVSFCKIQQTLRHHSIEWIMVDLNLRFAVMRRNSKT